MTARTAYQCDPSGLYIGETAVQENAFAPGEFLLPPNCTLEPPPAFDSTRQVAVRKRGVWKLQMLRSSVDADPERAPAAPVPTEANMPTTGPNEIALIVDGRWKVVPDFRGRAYWLRDGSKHVVHALGAVLPTGALDAPPPVEEAPPTPMQIDIEQYAKQMRFSLLTASDWVVLRALETGREVPREWAEYRQALRDAPDQSGWPSDVVWPAPPGK